MVIIYNIIEESTNSENHEFWSLKTDISPEWLDEVLKTGNTNPKLIWSREPHEQIITSRSFNEASMLLHSIVKEIVHIESFYKKNFYISPIITHVAEEITWGPSKDNSINHGIDNVNSQNLYEIIKEVYQNTGYGILTMRQYKHDVPKDIRKSKCKIFDYWCRKLDIHYQTITPICDDDGIKFIITIEYKDTTRKVNYTFDKKSVMFSSTSALPRKDVYR